MYLISPYILQSLSITAYRRLTNNSKVITTWQTHQGTRSIITETSSNHHEADIVSCIIPERIVSFALKRDISKLTEAQRLGWRNSFPLYTSWRKLDAWDVWIANSRATTGRRSFGDYVKAAASMIWPLSLSGFTNSRPRPSDSTARY